MSVENVIFRKDNKKEVVSLVDIEGRIDFEEVKNNIYCPYQGCACKMLYVPRGKYAEYFKKWPDSKHEEDCPEYSDTTRTTRSKRTGNIDSRYLDDARLRRMGRDAFKKRKETPEQRAERLAKNRKYNKTKKRKRVNPDISSIETDVLQPTTENIGQGVREGERGPKVTRRYSIVNVSDDDIGNTIMIIDNLSRVDIEENSVELILTNDNNTASFSVYLGNPFFDNAPINTDTAIASLQQAVNASKEPILVTCTGLIHKYQNQIRMELNRETALTIEGKGLFSYLSGL